MDIKPQEMDDDTPEATRDPAAHPPPAFIVPQSHTASTKAKGKNSLVHACLHSRQAMFVFLDLETGG